MIVASVSRAYWALERFVQFISKQSLSYVTNTTRARTTNDDNSGRGREENEDTSYTGRDTLLPCHSCLIARRMGTTMQIGIGQE